MIHLKGNPVEILMILKIINMPPNVEIEIEMFLKE
jgi:hypothetical protein